ncbi:MAG: sigma-70 family RNA polymerase sigma factor [Bacteroidales bacterium]
MQPDPDRPLVQAAAAGDRDAFGALVLRYQSRIVNLARVMVSDAADADDLAQEAFIRAYKAMGKFRGDSSFRTWLYRVAVNVIQSHLASRSRRWRLWGVTRPRDDQGDVAAELPSPAPSAEDEAMRRQLIDRALASLPSEMRAVVMLRDVQGFEYAEIAQILGVPIGTVESRIFRARQRLRPLLAPLIGVGR